MIAPASDTNIGWRGDGTGRFPDADPPLTWGRVSNAVNALRFQAQKPDSETSGLAMPDGVIREWLVLGPIPLPDIPKPLEQETLPNELLLAPKDGEKTGPYTWKKIEADTATLDFHALLGATKGTCVYAHAYIHSESGGEFGLQATCRADARVLLNGKVVPGGQGRSLCKLEKGWNRLLLKVAADDSQCFAIPVFHAHIPGGYVEKNIAWTVVLPGARTYQGTPGGPGGPIVVGERIFVLCEPHELFCLDKATGKVRWVRCNSYFDALTEAERNAVPAFKDIEPLVAKWNALNAEYVEMRAPKTNQEGRDKLEKEIHDALKAIDKKRFTRPAGQDVGYAGMTPVSDGKFVYAWFASGVTACYDIDGNRQWIRIDNHEQVEHGFSSSPILVGDKLVVFMRDVIAFDAKTGTELWRNPMVAERGMNPGGWFHGSFTQARIGGIDTVIPANCAILRASDGKTLFIDPKLALKQEVATPVIDDGVLCAMTTANETLFTLRLPQTAGETLQPEYLTEVKIPTDQFPTYYLGWHLASPLVHDGLVYLLNNSGVLTVVDKQAGTIVYQKMLDLDPFQGHNEAAARGIGISTALGGKHLYFWGNSGAALVLEPGRVFKQLAKNKIEGLAVAGSWGERQDRAVAFPFFDGKRIYYRTESLLYALGAK